MQLELKIKLYIIIETNNMITDLQKEEMLCELSNQKSQVFLVDNKIYIQDLVEEVKNDSPAEFQPVRRMTGIETKKDIDKKKREVPVIKRNKNEISECKIIDGVEYFKWSIFVNPIRDEIIALPEPGRNMSYEGRLSYFVNPNREYGCKYLHPDQHSALKEYQIREIVFTKYDPITKYYTGSDTRTYDDFTDIFHQCMARDDTAKPDIY